MSRPSGRGGTSRGGPLRPISHQGPQGSWVGKLMLICLLGVGGYGGYYGYSRYKVADQQHRFAQIYQDLKNALLRRSTTVRAEDVRQVVLGFAALAGVRVDPLDMKVVIEPLTPESASRLPATARTGLDLAARIPGHRAPRWLVGFKGRFVARYGLVKESFEAERYTWVDDAEPGTGLYR